MNQGLVECVPNFSEGRDLAKIRRITDAIESVPGVNAVEVRSPSSTFADPEKDRAGIESWMKSFDRAAKELNRPGVLFYIYVMDEPNNEKAYAWVRSWGSTTRAASSSRRRRQTKPRRVRWAPSGPGKLCSTT